MTSIFFRLILVTIFAASCTSTPEISNERAPSTTSWENKDNIVPLTPSSRKPSNEELAWWGATELHVQNAACRERLPLTSLEIANYYKRHFSKTSLEPGSIHDYKGITLRNEEPALVLALIKLLSPGSTFRRTEEKDLPQDFTAKYRIPQSCQKALCVASAIFGKEVGPQMLFLMEQFEINTSPYSWKNADTFTADEIRDVIRTMELLDRNNLPYENNKQLIRFKRGYSLASYGDDAELTVANAVIHLFDGWEKESSLSRQYTLYHEFAHNYSDNYFADYDTSKTWKNLSQWQSTSNNDKEYVSSHQGKHYSPFVSKYGEANPNEDFAETLTTYRLNPSLLLQRSPEKYNLIKMLVFDGREFNNNKSCRTPTLISKFNANKNKAQNFSSSDFAEIKNKCSLTFYNTVLGNYPLSFFADCVDYEATLIWRKYNAKTYHELVSQSLFNQYLKKSQLKFPEITQKLIPEFSQEAGTWIYKNTKTNEVLTQHLSNDQYCDRWASLASRTFPTLAFSSQDTAARNTPSLLPRQGAARSVCLDLTEGFTPRSQSSPESIVLWLKSKLQLTKKTSEGENPTERIQEKAIADYIQKRFSYLK